MAVRVLVVLSLVSRLALAETTFTQTNEQSVFDCREFSVARGRTLRISQPSPDAVLFIRVHGDQPSLIEGRLESNGRIVLINEHGVSIQGSVNVGGLVTLAGASRVHNEGLLTARDVTFLASGTGELTNTGTIRARVIRLVADMKTGVVQAGGVLDASALTGDGELVETSAARVKIEPNVRVSTASVRGRTGRWLIDPNDFTIAASGGDLTGAALSANLATTSVVIESSSGANTAGHGDINVNDPVSWSANQLTLTAARHVNINAVMTASGTSSLALNPGTANGSESAVEGGAVRVGIGHLSFYGRVDFGARSGTGFFTVNGAPYVVINALGAEGSQTAADLQGMQANLTVNYALGADIDASPTATWNGGDGFEPVGAPQAFVAFNGNFEGLGHVISNLHIDRPARRGAALFGGAHGSQLGNVGFLGGSVRGDTYAGALLGSSSSFPGETLVDASVRNAFSNVNVFAEVRAGSLVGHAGNIYDSHATGNVTVNLQGAGGLAGVVSGYYFAPTPPRCFVERSYATGTVTVLSPPWGFAGGLLGSTTGCSIRDSYATGDVNLHGGGAGGLVGATFAVAEGTAQVTRAHATGNVTTTSSDLNEGVGGLIGFSQIPIADAYATGAVRGSFYVGGLVGRNWSTITDSRASAAVTGVTYTGGLVGLTIGATTITRSHAEGTTTGVRYTGGFVGMNGGTITESYATGPVIGAPPAGERSGATGGFVGGNSILIGPESSVGQEPPGTPLIRNCYATGDVTGDRAVGGFVGAQNIADNFDWYALHGLGSPYPSVTERGANIRDSYATGHVTGNSNVVMLSGTIFDYNASSLTLGGFVGVMGRGLHSSPVPLASCFYSGTVSGPDRTPLRGEGSPLGTVIYPQGPYAWKRTPAELKELATFTARNWDIDASPGTSAPWRIYEGNTTPLLRSLLTPRALPGTTRSYNGFPQSADAVVDALVLGTPASGTNVGTYSSGYYSTQLGFDLSGGELTITPATLTVSGLTADKVYDATRTATLVGTPGITPFNGDDVTLSGTASGLFDDKHAGDGKTVTLTGLSISGAASSNYLAPSSIMANISRAPLQVTGLSAEDKVYDATTVATITGTPMVTPIAGDVVTISGTPVGEFANASVGAAKPVTVSGLTLSGADSNNYSLVPPAGLTAEITPGMCPSGYTGDGVICDDVDECATNNGGCDALTACTNSPGSFSCGACPGGYAGTGATACTDIDECATNNGGCDALTACTNSTGSFSCGTCPNGYSGTGATACVDIDECATNNGGCDALAPCTNTPGAFTCGDCPAGYLVINGACVDIDECATNNGGCDALTACTNTPGSRSCAACPSGYTGTGATGCVDVDECAADNGGCSQTPLVACTNTPGSRTCAACPAGFRGDGVTCTADPVDADGDGFAVGVDCDDAVASINPEATEVCADGVDNDCNGKTDAEEEACAPPAPSGCGCSSMPGAMFFVLAALLARRRRHS